MILLLYLENKICEVQMQPIMHHILNSFTKIDIKISKYALKDCKWLMWYRIIIIYLTSIVKI